MAQPVEELTKSLYPDLPSDLPNNLPTHPGKRLSSRFSFDNKTRQIVTPALRSANHLASSVNFRPVTTMSIRENHVHVKPVGNVSPRHLSPLPKDWYIARGLGGEDIQEQVQKRLNEKLRELSNLARQTSPSENKAPEKKIEPSLDVGPPKQAQVAVEAKMEQPAANTPPPAPEQTTAPAATPPQPAPKAQADMGKLTAQLNQEIVQRTVAQNRVIELTNQYQTQMTKMVQQQNQLAAQLNDLKSRLAEETKKRQSSEAVVGTTTNQLQNEINRLKIERDSLLGQLKESQNKLGSFQDQQSRMSSVNVELTQLKAKLAQAEKEKSDTEQRAMKLEGLVEELRTKGTASQPQKDVVVPREVTEKAKDGVKIIHPAPAIGRMAPQLTTIPNVVNGVVKDKNGMLLTDVVIVVKDSAGNPVRALKSNKIGQFAISTPLPNGTYTMELEKAENEFDVVQISLEGKVMPPIEIKAR